MPRTWKIGLLSLLGCGLLLSLFALGLMRTLQDQPEKIALLMLKIYGVVALGVMGYLWTRSTLLRLRNGPTRREERGPTGAMVDTFQTLILQLKQKEQALEQLKRDAEERTKSVESYNENILRSVTSGVITLDLQKRITTFNAAAGQILNVALDTVMGAPYAAVVGDDLAAVLDTLGTREQRRMEYRVKRPDGALIYVGMNSSALRDGRNQIMGSTIVLTDLTEIKRLQEQIALQKRLALMGEMSSWVAHEFRNYMSTIMGFSSLLAKKIVPEDPKHGMALAIHQEVLSMEQLITQLLDYAKKSVLHTEPVLLEPLLRKVMDQFRTPTLHFQDSLKAVEAVLDPILIQQVFSNLVQNAVEAMDGMGTVSLEMVQRPDGIVRIRVADTGPGIPDERMEHLFLPFFTTKEKGTGLGLALAHKIVLAHKGHLLAERVEGGGARFTVELPVHTTS